MTGKCSLNVATYYDAIVSANQSGGCIDLAESQRLFDIAHTCNVTTSGDDGIQNLYKQITGIENPALSQSDSRATTGGYFRTYFGKDSPFPQNKCDNFDTVQKERKIICAPDVSKKQEDLVVTMNPVPIHWCDADETGTPYHVNARNGAFVIRDEKENWRVLLRNEEGKPLVSTATALDMIQKNLPYPEIVEHAVKLGIEGTRDPWKVSKFAAEVFDTLIAARTIDESAKLVYANIVSTYTVDRFRQLPDQVYSVMFEAQFGKTFYSFQASNLTKSQLGDEWKANYYKDGVGFYHGAANTLAISSGVITTVTFAGQVGWAVGTTLWAGGGVAAGVAAGAAVIASAPLTVTVGLVALGVGLLSMAAVKLYGWYKEDDEQEKQYHEKVLRFEPRVKNSDDISVE